MKKFVGRLTLFLSGGGVGYLFGVRSATCARTPKPTGRPAADAGHHRPRESEVD